MVANAVEQSSSSTAHYGYSALPAPAADTSTGHSIDALYPADVYERLVAVSAAPTLSMSHYSV